MASRLTKNLSYAFNSFIRTLPNFLTNPFPPSLMPKKNLKEAKGNPFKIPANRTSQAICAKHCGNCPSNPFTHGGLYCISGKSKKEVSEAGCNCFNCELFDECGGGRGYFCKFGTAQEMNNPIPVDSSPEEAQALTRDDSSEDAYHQRYIGALIDEDEKIQNEQKQLLKDDQNEQKTKEINITYDGEGKTFKGSNKQTILEISKSNGIPHVHACGGKAKCSTCRVLVLSGLNGVQKRNAEEKKLAKRKSFSSGIRLACQTRPQGDVVVRRLVVDEQQMEDAIAEGRFYPGPFGLDKTVTVMFTDIRSFTGYSENALPYDIVHILNEYYETVCTPIDKYNGYVDKYMGDGIMAIFGITSGYDDGHQSVMDAMNASFEMIENLNDFNKGFQKKYGHQFRIGIGLHAGDVVLAKLGFRKKRQFTAIGDTVNTASRIEGATKEHGAVILASEKIYKMTKSKFVWGRNFSQLVKGKKDALQLYEPLKVRGTKNARKGN